MIESQLSPTQTPQTQANTKPRKILRMVENDRMGGMVPKWELPKTSADKVQHALETAQYNDPSFANTLSYAAGQVNHHQQEEFGFGDLVDMVNPLHHIPVVGHVYRGITGDQIQPIGQIMGGAVYGGIGGVVSGLANTILEEETGTDMAGNAVNLVEKAMGSLPPEPLDAPVTIAPSETETIAALEPASGSTSYEEDLPGNLLSFVDMKADNGMDIARVNEISKPAPSYPNLDKLPMLEREPITEVKMSGLYALASK